MFRKECENFYVFFNFLFISININLIGLKSENNMYYGHSSNVTNLKFLSNGTHLISIGGDDFW